MTLPRLLDDSTLSTFLSRKLASFDGNSDSFISATDRIRRWVSALVPIDPQDTLGLDRQEPDIHAQPLSTVVTKLARRQGSFLCGGTNNTLARIFRLLGYEAVTLCVGEPSLNLQHIIVLVRAPTADGERLEVHDSYFNYTLVDTNNQKMDYFDACNVMRMNGSPTRVCFSSNRTWKTELSLGQGSTISKRLRSWYWRDPEWARWLEMQSIRELSHALSYPIGVYGGESDRLWREVREKISAGYFTKKLSNN